MSIGSRIRQYRKEQNISQVDFAKTIGIKQSPLSQIESDKILPSLETVKRIIRNFNISYKFILEGYDTKVSENLLNEPDNIKTYKLHTDNNHIENQKIPLYDIEAVAGLVPLFKDTQQITPLDHISIPHIPKCDGAVYVTGDSMYPLLKSGDIVIYKEINDIKNDIFWGEMYLISISTYDEEYIAVKYIQKSEKGDDYVKLVSQNKHHQDRNIKKNRINALALVKASIRINSMN